MSPINVSAASSSIDVSAGESAVEIEVSAAGEIGVEVVGGQGPAGPAGANGEQGPPGDPASLPAGTEGYVLTYVSDEWVAAEPAGGYDQSLNTTDTPTFDGIWISGTYPALQIAQTVGLYYDVNAGYWFFDNGDSVNGLIRNFSLAACDQIAFSDETTQTTAWTGTVGTENVTGLGGAATLNVGSTAGTVAAGDDARFTDARTPTSHAHGNLTNAGAIGTTSGLPIVTTTSGVLTTGAFGTSAGQFAAGDHTHSQLHDRSHAITSASDHTATSWRLFHSNGSGEVVELAFGNSGQALISNGASAAPSWGSAGSNSASDLTIGSLSDARLSTNAQAAINLYLWSSFR